MAIVDLHFPVLGSRIPTDHGYALYAAVARIVPAVHANESPFRIAPIGGTYAGQGTLIIDQGKSRFRIRLPAEDIPVVLALAGKILTVGEHKIRLGVPQVRALTAAPSLVARAVVMKASSPRHIPTDNESRDRAATKRYLDPVGFLGGIRNDLSRRGIGAHVELSRHAAGPHAGEPRRHVLRIHGKAIVGFTVLAKKLTAEASIRLQEEGIGGRRKMGCGFFVPTKDTRL
jgi:Cas6 Crispr